GGGGGAPAGPGGGGPLPFSPAPAADFAQGESCTATVLGAQVAAQGDPSDVMTANDSWSFTTVGAAVRIHDIQGRAHVSPLKGRLVSGVPGTVTATRSNGYYLQDPDPDADHPTSEGLFVFTSTAPAFHASGSGHPRPR